MTEVQRENQTETSQRILREFQAGNCPTATAGRVMTTGTGGLRIWERLWSRMMPGTRTEQEEMLRAMGFARDLARQAEVSLVNLDQSFFRMTGTAIEMAHRFQQDLRKAGITPPELRRTPESPANRFARTFPDWNARWAQLHQLAADTLDIGRHLALIGLLEADPARIGKATGIIEAATRECEHAVCSLAPDGSGIQPPPDLEAQMTHGALSRAAWARLKYITELTQHCGQTHGEARRVVASSLCARDAHRAQRENAGTLWEMPDCLERDALRNLSDRILREDRRGILQQAVDALTEDEPEQVRQALQLITELRDYIRTIPHVDHQAILARVQTGMRGLGEQLQNPSEDRHETAAKIRALFPEPGGTPRGLPGGLTGMLAADAAERTEAAADAILQVADGNANRPDPRIIMWNELREALTIREMLRRELLQKKTPARTEADTEHPPVRCPHGLYYWYPFECWECIRGGLNVLPGGRVVETQCLQPGELPRVMPGHENRAGRAGE